MADDQDNPEPPTDWTVFELRQYTLHPGQRDTLITLFDREFVESQEAVGIRVVGQFRDLDRPNAFVWIRGFRDMATRAEALAAFYGGPVWKTHRDQANATMVDSDDVLLLRPAREGWGFPAPERPRAPADRPRPGRRSIVTATICHRDTPLDDALVEFFSHSVAPLLAETGSRPLAFLRIEPAENTFPALPVRTGEHVLVWFSSFASLEHHRAHERRLEGSWRWRDDVLPALLTQLSGPPQQLRLAPTARSLLY
jgi:hypothetical protein